MEQAQLTWYPKRHHVWSASFRRSAHMVMLVGHHLARDATWPRVDLGSFQDA